MIEWGTPGRASVLCDGAFGSTGKGLAAAWLAGRRAGRIDVATTAAGANSGHTTRYRDGRTFVAYHLPTTSVVLPDCPAYINAGAIVDVEALGAELDACGVSPVRVIVHPRAAVITEEHRAAERASGSSTSGIASTQHGVGAALSDKIWRRSPLVQGIERPPWMRVGVVDLNDVLSRGSSAVVEIPQGVDLGLNHGFSYPQATSRDCYVTTGLEYAGIHPHFLGPVAMVTRTFPIRVGNLRNELGEELGNSGPFYPDSEELDWDRDFPGIEPERTTVTRRVRRVASWSDMQYAHALRLNRPTIVILTFCNYLRSADAFYRQVRRMRSVEASCGLQGIKHAYSTSPFTEDVTEDFGEAAEAIERR